MTLKCGLNQEVGRLVLKTDQAKDMAVIVRTREFRIGENGRYMNA